MPRHEKPCVLEVRGVFRSLPCEKTLAHLHRLFSDSPLDKILDILEDQFETFDIISSANIYQELYPLEDGTTVTAEIESLIPLTETEREKLKFIMEKHLSEDETLRVIYTQHE